MSKATKICALSVVFTQEPDACADGDSPQTISVKVEDGGGGPYFTIETDRFAFDSPSDFVALLDSVQGMIAGKWDDGEAA